MNNQNDNQKTQSTNDQDLLNQYASSIKPENNDETVSGSLKDFNSTPIDTPTPISLDDSLSPSESLPEESITPQSPDNQKQEINSHVEPNIELNQESEIKPESQTFTDESAETDTNSKVDTIINTDINTQTEINTETQSPSTDNPQDIKQKIDEVLSYNSTNSVVNSGSEKPKTSKFLKIIFSLSLIIFITVAAGLAYFIFNPSQKTNPEIKTTPTSVPVQSGITCELNGFIYSLDQSFPSADGCNTCTCVSANNIECTEKDCVVEISTSSATISPTVTPINKAQNFN